MELVKGMELVTPAAREADYKQAILYLGVKRMLSAKGSVAQAIRTLTEELESAEGCLNEERYGADW